MKPFIDMSLKAQELGLNGIERASSGCSTASYGRSTVSSLLIGMLFIGNTVCLQLNIFTDHLPVYQQDSGLKESTRSFNG